MVVASRSVLGVRIRPVPRTNGNSLPCASVAHVVVMRSLIEMRRIHTAPVVAVVVDLHAISDGTDFQFEGETVGADLLRAIAKRAVSVGEAGCLPLPTGFRAPRPIYLRPEPFHLR